MFKYALQLKLLNIYLSTYINKQTSAVQLVNYDVK